METDCCNQIANDNGYTESPFDDDTEREHFQSILAAYKYYRSHSLQRITKVDSFISTLPVRHRKRLERYIHCLTKLRDCVEANNAIIRLIIEDVEGIFQNVPATKTGSGLFDDNPDSDMNLAVSDATVPGGKLRPTIHDVEKVQSVLKQLVRDWSDQGAEERSQCYQPIIDTILEEFPHPSDEISVLVPGAGLGRLAYEVAIRGYRCQGNEFSLFMLFASNFVLNKCHQLNKYTIHPWVHQYVNNLSCTEQLRSVSFPDTNPADLSGADFSMVAGDFVKVYENAAEWNCVATCFFIDCAPNVIDFIETIYHILKPGAIWVNLGPLLYHYSDMPSEDSIEPPFDVLLDIIRDVGFIIEKSRTGVKSKYAQNPRSMLQYEYDSLFFVCRKPLNEVINTDNV